MKNYLLLIVGVSSFLFLATTASAMSGNTEKCSRISDEKYGSKTICVNNSDAADTQRLTQFEKACVTLPDSDGNVGQTCKLCRCITGQAVKQKMPGSLYQCSDGSTPECVDEEKN